MYFYWHFLDFFHLSLLFWLFSIIIVTTRFFIVSNYKPKSNNIQDIKKWILSFLNYEKFQILFFLFIFFNVISIVIVFFFWNEKQALLQLVICWISLLSFIELNVRKNNYYNDKIFHIYKKLPYKNNSSVNYELNGEHITNIRYNEILKVIILTTKNEGTYLNQEEVLSKEFIKI